MRFALLFLINLTVLAASFDIVTFQYDPFIREDGTGSLQNKVIEATNKKDQVNFHVLPIARAMNHFKTDKGLFLGTKNQFSPNFSKELKQITLNNLNTHFYMNNRRRQKIKTIAVLLGNDGEKRLVQHFPSARLVQVKNANQALMMIEKNRVDGFFCIARTCDDIIVNNKYRNIQKSIKVYKRLKVGIIYHKKYLTPTLKKFLNDIRKGLKQ
jgi:hypothetical protein